MPEAERDGAITIGIRPGVRHLTFFYESKPPSYLWEVTEPVRAVYRDNRKSKRLPHHPIQDRLPVLKWARPRWV